ncbi:hypothetical protein [Thiomicrospira cyclica]|uniref:Uncharacterized protein n=1 Tax=Thiomicrospira cyclica (strain DSM 14477 / JCM 11371 / ALM1) TaxID=717773 RepID=F6D8T2_THICA|nr:hypothetical protein [Thiomicrospira cyclica]AEG31932.1 hypothetical protein Thicy_1165 [Thiomicrospira cyclica ALM1]
MKASIKPLVVSLGLTTVLAFICGLHLVNYQQLKSHSKIATKQANALQTQSTYQHWLNQIDDLAKPVRHTLQLEFSIDDWLHELEDWQTRYQQAWPDVVFEQTEPAFAWQQFQLKKQVRISTYNDYQAWQAWQSQQLKSTVLPGGCRWQAHLNNTRNEHFIGSIDCEWLVNQWQGIPGLSQVIKTDIPPTLASSKPAEVISVAEQAQVIFMGVLTQGQDRYVSIDGAWMPLPTLWCQWIIAQYDGQALILTSTTDPGFAQRIRLGQSLPNC